MSTKIGDRKTIYSWAEHKLIKIQTTCIGFMLDDTPVWYASAFNSHSLEPIDLYIAFDGQRMQHGYYETPEEVFDAMSALADLYTVRNQHLLADIEAERRNWEEEEDGNS